MAPIKENDRHNGSGAAARSVRSAHAARLPGRYRRALGIAALCLCLIASACATALPAASAPSRLTPAEREAGWQLLFDGTSLTGWRASEHPDSFRVRDGRIVVRGPRAHLYYTGPVERHDFRDFELRLEVMTFPGANSGVYFHTAWQDSGWPVKGYEVQVNNTQSDPKRTGGLYGIRDNFEAPVADNTWFTLSVRVEGKRIRTFVDGRPIADYIEDAQPQRPAEFGGRLLGSGTFALQAHDPDSEVHYRSIKVRALP